MKNKNLSDWIVALAVIGCSAVLFLALAFALSGRFLGKPAKMLRVNFHDVTGVGLSAQVKYAGAPAGRIAGIRMLSPQERAESGDPSNAVQVTLALSANVPPLPSDIKASVAADTLLSDKFILLNGGTPDSPPLAEDAVIQGISPTTFDKLARDTDSAIEGLREMLGGTKGETGDVFRRIRDLLGETQSLIAEARPVLEDAKILASDARQLISENKAPITRTMERLDKASGDFQQLASRGNSLLANNEKKLTSTLSDLKVTSENLKVTSTYTKFFTRSLNQRPTQLIWGTSRPPVLPSEQQILQATKPIPAN